MPKTQSAKENLRKDKRRYLNNRKRKDAVKSAVKQIKKIAVNGQAGDAEKTKQAISQAYKALDKAAKRGTIKKNTASRKKSRLTKFLYKSTSAKTA